MFYNLYLICSRGSQGMFPVYGSINFCSQLISYHTKGIQQFLFPLLRPSSGTFIYGLALIGIV